MIQLATKFTVGFWGSMILANVVKNPWVAMLCMIFSLVYLFMDIKTQLIIQSKTHEREEEHKEEPQPTVGE
jgi:hypothetical protein